MKARSRSKSPAPIPRTRRAQPNPYAAPPGPPSPLMIKRTGKILNFTQAYGVKFDKDRLHSSQTDASGSVYSTSQSLIGVVKMNEAMSTSWNYFEVEIIKPGDKTAIGIGVGPYDNSLYHMPGWTAQSFGYHADDGNLFNQNGYGLPFGPTCTKGDVMGCGIDFEGAANTGYVRIWFTKNSTVVGSPVKAKLPSMGFHGLIGMHYLGVIVKYLGHSQQKTPFSVQLLVDYPFPGTLLTSYPQDGIGPNQLTLREGDEVDVSEEEWLQGCEWLQGTKLSEGTVGLFCRQLVKFDEPDLPLGNATKIRVNADQVHIYKGKELTSVNKPETWYACIICQELAVTPLQTTCCAQTLCQSCTDRCRKFRHQLGSCPHCRNAHWQTSPDARLTRLISDLEVFCHNHLKGCQWHGELRNVQEHLDKKCDFELIQCPSGCSVQIERRLLANHIQFNCLDSQWKCRFCNALMTKRKLFFHHYKICTNWPALCPHMCKERTTWTKSQLTQHLVYGCDEEIVKCKFACAGCKAKLMRREVKEHMQSALAAHVTLLLEENIALKKEVKDLKDTVYELQERLP